MEYVLGTLEVVWHPSLPGMTGCLEKSNLEYRNPKPPRGYEANLCKWCEKCLGFFKTWTLQVRSSTQKNRELHQVEYVFQGLGVFFIIQNWEFCYYFDGRPASLAGRRKPHVTFQSLVLSPSNASTKCWRWLLVCSPKFRGRKWGPGELEQFVQLL